VSVLRITDEEFERLLTSFDREAIRWVPRSLVSSAGVPGNDFYLFDDRLVVFLAYTGTGLDAGKFTSCDRGDIHLCRSAFEAVWKLSVPHRAYHPV
jgi:hypothetical protein